MRVCVRSKCTPLDNRVIQSEPVGFAGAQAWTTHAICNMRYAICNSAVKNSQTSARKGNTELYFELAGGLKIFSTDEACIHVEVATRH